GARRPAPSACPDCGGLGLQPQGAGTERIEEVLQERFPGRRVVRIDRGSTRQRDGLAQRLAEFGDGPGILVGTQMLAKGHDLPNLTLVAVVGIDEGLFSADFRAPEKLAQLLIQVAGRSGRAARPGRVLLQTHHPDHPLLATLLQGGYHAFAAQELGLREAAGFPPFAYLALLRAEARQLADCDGFLRAARAVLEEEAGEEPAVDLHGPLPAPMPRRAGYQRTQLLLSSPVRPGLHALLGAALPRIRALPEARRVRWSLDVDPVDLYCTTPAAIPDGATTDGPVSGAAHRETGLRRDQAANSARIFFRAFASIWRIRSADTPYSSASSCRVTLPSLPSQRRATMSRERSSSCDMPSRSSDSWLSSSSSRAYSCEGSSSSARR